MSEVASPCIGLCEVDADGICRGCLRTLSEIGAWRDASDTERCAILALAVARRSVSSAVQPYSKTRPNDN